MDIPNTILCYANIKPEQIKAQETYGYHILISSNSDVQEQKSTGLLAVEVPYDGYKAFSRETAKELEEKVTHSESEMTGRIGWLVLSHPLDWGGGWRKVIGITPALPVDIPLIGNGLENSSEWTADEKGVRLLASFDPKGPQFRLAEMDIHLYDDESIPKTAEEVIHSLYNPDSWSGQMVLDMTIKIYVPSLLPIEKRNSLKVKLDKVSIQWPTVMSSGQLSIKHRSPINDEKTNYQPADWHNNPVERTIELTNIEIKNDQELINSLIPYSLQIRFHLKTPYPVIKQVQLLGSMRILLEGLLLSGREIAWLNPNGMRSKETSPIKEISSLDITFAAFLPDLLRRQTTTSRRWMFPGIKLTPTRVHDMEMTLRDMGFKILNTIKDRREGDQQTSSVRTYIYAEQWVHAPSGEQVKTNLKIWLSSENNAETQRDREMPDGIKVSTKLPTEDLVIQLWGTLFGPGSQLDLILEELLVVLNERFATVADVR